MKEIVDRQRSYFLGNATKPVAFRIAQLTKLKAALVANERLLDAAIAADIGKSRFENILTELYTVYEGINLAIASLERWARPQVVAVDPLNQPADCYVAPEPLGVSLIIGPWNYPFQLTLSPLLGALAAGCTVVLKPSERTPHCSAALAKILGEAFEPQYLAVVEGAIPETTALLDQKFDTIFFTGSVPVGKIVYAAAAKHLTPVTLELGGKSPVIVMADADLDVTAKRIVWGKMLNAGQTCIAPDYLCVHASVEQALLERLSAEIRKRDYKLENGNFAQILDARNVARLAALIDPAKVYVGGKHDGVKRTFEPTILRGVTWDDKVMQEEIFGPILPVLAFERLEDVIAQIKARPKPLALYLFTGAADVKKKVLGEVSFGGGCVNDTVLQVANGLLPFGGVGDSGMGRYHGEEGFKAFSHYKSIVDKGFGPEVALRYSPYTKENLVVMESLIDPKEAT